MESYDPSSSSPFLPAGPGYVGVIVLWRKCDIATHKTFKVRQTHRHSDQTHNQKHITYRQMISTFTSSISSWVKPANMELILVGGVDMSVYKKNPDAGRWALDESPLSECSSGLTHIHTAGWRCLTAGLIVRAGPRPFSDHTLCHLYAMGAKVRKREVAEPVGEAGGVQSEEANSHVHDRAWCKRS